jgi:hypothetical protein
MILHHSVPLLAGLSMVFFTFQGKTFLLLVTTYPPAGFDRISRPEDVSMIAGMACRPSSNLREG